MAFLYKRNNGVWYVGYRVNKRIKRVSTGERKKGKAERRRKQFEEIEFALKHGLMQPSVELDIDVAGFWAAYEDWARAHKSPNTIKAERLLFNKLVKSTCAERLGDIKKSDIEKIKRAKISAGIKPRSVNTFLARMQALYNHAVKLGLYSGPNPFKGVAHYKVPKNPPKYLSKEDIGLLLAKAKTYSENIYIVIALGVYTGMRRGEIVNARWDWIDFSHKLVTIKNSESFHIKDREARTVPLSDKLADILMPYREESGYVLMPEKVKWQGRHRYLFRRAFENLTKLTSYEWVTPHVLRHTFASQLAIAGVSLYKISKWLGHADFRTTQIYAHLTDYDESINWD